MIYKPTENNGHIRILDALKNGHGNMVQLFFNAQPFLVIGSQLEGHGQILERILQEREVGFEREEVGCLELPALHGNHYGVAGMGFAELTENKIHLYGRSATYDIQINPAHARQLANRLRNYEFSVEFPEGEITNV